MTEFPALLVVATGEYHALGSDEGETEVGRGLSAHLKVPETNRYCSRRQFRVVLSSGNYYLENLSQTNPTYYNGTPLQAPVVLTHGDQIRVGSDVFIYAEQPIQADDLFTCEDYKMIPAKSTCESAAHEGMTAGEFQLRGPSTVGRDRERSDLHLPHPQVSRVHAQVVRENSQWSIIDLHSANGTYVNGQRVTKRCLLETGDRIEIGPFSLLFTGTSLDFSLSEGNLNLVASNLVRTVKDPTTKKGITILDDVSLVIEPNEFVVLLGPSGSGKSTLMNAISGRALAMSGTVMLNNNDLYQNFDALKRTLALVPQRDVVHRQLTAWQALNYTADLRLPPDTSKAEMQLQIETILKSLGLEHRRDTRIKHLSGGEVKRACLANEIVARPSLLFLDEVTSGLDQQTDREMMANFQKVARSGKTVICVTHSLANVDKFCDLVVFLAPGGKLAFYGSSREAREFFGVPDLGEVYDRIAEKPPNEWQDLYRNSNYYGKYITSRMPRTIRQFNRKTRELKRRRQGPGLGECLRQTGILTRRYARTTATDKSALLSVFGQAAIIALLIWVVFGNLSGEEMLDQAMSMAKLLFFLSISCIWCGCNNAAKELIKEREIYRCERNVNLIIPSYYLSKVFVLGVLGFLQTLILYLSVRWACSLEGSLGSHLLILNLASANGMTLGLLISAIAKTPDMAATIVPIVLIPQVLFAGMLVPLKSLAEVLAKLFCANYWSYNALKAALPDAMLQLKVGMPGAQEPLLGESGNIGSSVAVLTLLTIVHVAGALFVLKWKDLKDVNL